MILPLFSGPQLLMTRNLLYTGITRAKTCVCVVGRYETFRSMILNNQEQRRYSGLRELIEECYGSGDPQMEDTNERIELDWTDDQ